MDFKRPQRPTRGIRASVRMLSYMPRRLTAAQLRSDSIFGVERTSSVHGGASRPRKMTTNCIRYFEVASSCRLCCLYESTSDRLTTTTNVVRRSSGANGNPRTRATGHRTPHGGASFVTSIPTTFTHRFTRSQIYRIRNRAMLCGVGSDGGEGVVIEVMLHLRRLHMPMTRLSKGSFGK